MRWGDIQTTLVPAAADWCTVRANAGDAAPFMFVTPPQNREELPARLVAAGIGQTAIDAFMAQFVNPGGELRRSTTV